MMRYIIRLLKPASPPKPQPPPWRAAAYLVSSLAWFAAMACTTLALVESQPFDGEDDVAGGLKSCGKYVKYECYHATTNARLNSVVKIDIAGVSFIV